MFKPSLFACMLLFSLTGWTQTQPLIVPAYVRIPLDSVQKDQLIRSLGGFLSQISGANKNNAFVQPAWLPETSDLLDEIRGMDKPLRGGKDSCHCYLTNVNQLDSADCLVQFAYLGRLDTIPFMRASFRLLAHRENERFLFSSPLHRNTTGWNVRTVDDFTFYYPEYPFNETMIAAYVKKAKEFDRKLHAPEYRTRYYCCATFGEALEALGVDYKMDYNGVYADRLTAFEQQTSLNVLGGIRSTLFDFHDLWHDRLHAVVPVSTINKPVDESCAYLYGGSWGLSWEEIFRQFKVYIGGNKDWLTVFTDNKNFARPNENHLYVSYVITALIAKKIEKEKGFPAVLQLLTCGRYQPDNENFFQALDKIIGVNRANFNTTVQQLMNDPSIAPATL